mmetsp:Transcript_70721/g.134666  ORF Transcript_70721/g.134666 Transcript_70721/m.134666 type:complete len:94 (-) Transcript_70721:1261-1542(-)
MHSFLNYYNLETACRLLAVLLLLLPLAAAATASAEAPVVASPPPLKTLPVLRAPSTMSETVLFVQMVKLAALRQPAFHLRTFLRPAAMLTTLY